MTTTPPPATGHRHRVLTGIDRAAVALVWMTPLTVAGWGWSVLPTSDPAGAPTAASMTGHLTVTLVVAFVAVLGVAGAVIATREARIYRADPDNDVLEREVAPLPVMLVVGAAIYAGFAVVWLLSLYSGLFPPSDLPPQPI